MTAIIHKEALEGLRPGDKAVFFRNDEPAMASPGAPDVRTESALGCGHRPGALCGREGAWGWTGTLGGFNSTAKPRELLVVPESSVLYSGDGAYVLAAPAGGHAFTRRSIQVGRILDSGSVADQAAERLGGIVVLSGLSEGERVVTQ